jgi:hypothetical protein
LLGVAEAGGAAIDATTDATTVARIATTEDRRIAITVHTGPARLLRCYPRRPGRNGGDAGVPVSGRSSRCRPALVRLAEASRSTPGSAALLLTVDGIAAGLRYTG